MSLPGGNSLQSRIFHLASPPPKSIPSSNTQLPISGYAGLYIGSIGAWAGLPRCWDAVARSGFSVQQVVYDVFVNSWQN